MAKCERVEIPQPKYTYKLELSEDEIQAVAAAVVCIQGKTAIGLYREIANALDVPMSLELRYDLQDEHGTPLAGLKLVVQENN